MIEITGEYNTALCYSNELEKTAFGQIKAMCDAPYFKDSKIRIMPDVHAGKGCTVGTAMTVSDKVVPGMVGVDIGCGMETVKIAQRDVNLQRLDELIKNEIPCGRNIRKIPHPLAESARLENLLCEHFVNTERAKRSIGTLGGGNHFIELDKDEQGNIYLVVHSGSRHLGAQAAAYYSEEGFNTLCGAGRAQINAKIKELKESGNTKEIHKTIKEMKKLRAELTPVPKELAYVQGELFLSYIHDMKLIQRFAALNRKAIADIILKGMDLTPVEQFTTVHNYIDTESMILRKGAVSARLFEKLLIPINMRDGSLICEGLGNPEWNCSAPHGAGRLMSRKEAFNNLSLLQFKEEMKGIYSSCISFDTLDESPMAYKSMEYIAEQIKPTAKILSVIKPIYNFKAAE